MKAGDRPYKVGVARTQTDRYHIRVTGAAGDAVAFDALLERLDEHLSRLTVNGRAYRLATAVHGPVHVVDVEGVTYRVSRDEGGMLRAPAPALVVATPVAAGADVSTGSPVLVLESMKMETVLRAPFDARVRELLVSVGSQVASGTPLARLEPAGTGKGKGTGEGQRLPAAPVDLMIPPQAQASAVERSAAALERLRSLILGFDLTGNPPADMIADYLSTRDGAVADGAPAQASELDLVAAFADIADLSSYQPGFGSHRSMREQFHTYLQSLDVDRAGVSEEFRRALEHALRHYGVANLDPALPLEQAVFRIFLARGGMTPGCRWCGRC